jgi:hypothetical protein
MTAKREPRTPRQALETLDGVVKTVDGLPASPDPELVEDLVQQADEALETLKREYVVDPKTGRRHRLRQRFS